MKHPVFFGIKEPHFFILVTLWLIVHAVLFSTLGIRDTFVDSVRYMAMADYLLTHGTFEFLYQIFYAIPILLIAVFRFLLPDGIIAFVIFQSVLSGVAALALYKSASAVFKNSNAGLIAAAIFLCWLDCVQWNTAVMTESVAGSIVCLVIHRLAYFSGSIKDYAVLFLLVVLCILTRPTGVLIAAGAIGFLLTRYWNVLGRRPFLKFSTLMLMGVIAIIGAAFMLNEWDFTDQYLKGNIVTYMDTIEGQGHYHENLRLDTRDVVVPPADIPASQKIIFFAFHNPLHFTKAAVLKIFYVVSFIRPYFSFLHNLYTVVWLSLIYVFFYLGCKHALDKPVRNFCLTVIISNCLLVGISAADWDNRFYMPMQPGIALLAGGGGSLIKLITGFRITD